MRDQASAKHAISEDDCAMIARAFGVDIAPDRLPGATAALREIFSLSAIIASVDVEGIDPGVDDVQWQEVVR